MEAVKVRKPHVLAVPLAAQGHVKPLMKLSRQIAKHGIKVTFVILQSIYERLSASAEMAGEEEDNIVLATIPDVLIPEDDPNNPFQLVKALRNSMPASLADLIERINSANPDEKVSCVIADVAVGWILETAQKTGADPILFSPASAAFCIFMFHIHKLLQDGIVDTNGCVKKGETIKLSDDIPAWGEDEVSWSFPSNPIAQKAFFELAKQGPGEINPDKWMLINTSHELESGACDLNPSILPIGPLLEIDASRSCSGSCNFYPGDASCLSWLESKPPGSVIYVSFGSFAVVSQQQLDELALGLELSGRAFLWVVRSDLVNGSRAVYPDGFLERVINLGKIVEWAPQEKVLSHPSVACFLSHCGWNSILEGLSKGVPFLCWPCFGDQFHNQNYICDKWETGLRISQDEGGIRSRHVIKNKIDMVFSNDNLKANALRLKEISTRTVYEGGSSYKNFEKFIDYLRK